MIKAEELRVGNWVDASNSHCQDSQTKVIEIQRKYISVKTGDDLANSVLPVEINPIPLTEEIMLKCGFVRQDKSLVWGVFEFTNGVMWLEYNSGYSSLSLSVDHIQSLHQLQNLIYALTGEELIINL